MNKTDSILVCGAGGFIGGHLVKYLFDIGFTNIYAVDIKPLKEWEQIHGEVVNYDCVDLRKDVHCQCVISKSKPKEIYNLAASMGGIEYIENNRIDCMENIFINLYLLREAVKHKVERYFFSSSACIYPAYKQSKNLPNYALKEDDAYPAESERGYGWEKLYSEMLCQEYWAEKGLKTFIARFHNIMGPYGTWQGGREKAPAAICRKVIEAKYSGNHIIDIWGDGEQKRSFCYIDDCVHGIFKIAHCDSLIATPINLGTSEMVTINQLVSIAEDIAGIKCSRIYDKRAPQGVGGRSSDNTFIKNVLDWEPSIKLREGMKIIYNWIEMEMKKQGLI